MAHSLDQGRRNSHPPIPLSPPPSVPPDGNGKGNDTKTGKNQASKPKIVLTVNTTLPRRASSSSPSPKVMPIPKIITPSSPQKSVKSTKSQSSANSITISPSESAKSNGSQKPSSSVPRRKKKLKLTSSRNSFLHGSPLYGEVSNKMSLLFHAAHNESSKKSNSQKHYTSSSQSFASAPRNSTFSFNSSPVLTASSTTNTPSTSDRTHQSIHSNASAVSSPNSSNSAATNVSSSTQVYPNESSTNIRNDSYDSASASFTSALSTNSAANAKIDSQNSGRGKNVSTCKTTYQQETPDLNINSNISEQNNNDNAGIVCNDDDDDEDGENDHWEEGMFENFSFENMIANRYMPLEGKRVSRDLKTTADTDVLKSRVVSEPANSKTSMVGSEITVSNVSETSSRFSPSSAPVTRKPSDSINLVRKIPPISNTIITAKQPNSQLPLQLQPITKTHSSESSVESPLNKNQLVKVSSAKKSTSPLAINTQISRSIPPEPAIASSPIKTDGSTSGKTSRNVSRSGSVHSRASTTSTSQRSFTHYNKSHKRSSSKGSLHDITTPKSFFKFFGSKKYSSNNLSYENNQQKHHSSHSHSNSQGSDNFSLHSVQGISPILSSGASMQQSKNNSPGLAINESVNGKNDAKTRWEDHKRESTTIPEVSQGTSENSASIGTSTRGKSQENIYMGLNTGSMPTLLPIKNEVLMDAEKRNTLTSIRTESIESLGSLKNANRFSVIPVPSSTTSSNNPPPSLYSFHHKLSRSNDPILVPSNRNSVLISSPTSLSAGTTPISANPTTVPTATSSSQSTSPTAGSNLSPATHTTKKVKSFVKLGSKSIRYSRGSSSLASKSFSNRKKPSVQTSDWDTWDGHSGSFEKIGPVGRKPSPPGQTIPVVTTSNLHISGENKKTSIQGRPSIVRLSSSSLPTLIASSDNCNALTAEQPLYKLVSEMSTPTSEAVSNSGLLSIYAAPSNSISKASLPADSTHPKYRDLKLNSKFLPKTQETSSKIMVTTNFVDYRLVNFSSASTLTMFTSVIQHMFRIKGDAQFFLTNIGSTREQLGKCLDKAALQNIWNHMSKNPESLTLAFYVTSDNKQKSVENNTSPSKLGMPSKNDHHSSHHEKVEETSLYTTSSYTNSINSDSSYDKNLPTPQHLISTRKDSSVDYWSFKDSVERKPSLNRAISVTHSSISGDSQTMASAPSLSRKASKISVGSGASNLASQSHSTHNSIRSSTKTLVNPTPIPANNEKLAQPPKLKGSFKVIPPQKPHVDFDNKRPTPFIKSKNLVAQRYPPPPPVTPPAIPCSTSSNPQTPAQSSADLSSSNFNSNHLTNIDKPAPGFSRAARSQKKKLMISNSLRSLQRSNTQGSLLSTKSSSSGVSIDPFSENKISFTNFESDDSVSTESSDTRSENESEDGDDEFGLFAKKPKTSEPNKLENLKMHHKNVSGNEPALSSDEDDTFELFQRPPRDLKILSKDRKDGINMSTPQQRNFTGKDNKFDKSDLEDDNKAGNRRELYTHQRLAQNGFTPKHKRIPPELNKQNDIYNESLSSEANSTEDFNSITKSFSEDSYTSSPADSNSSLSSSLDLRPPPEVLYNNLEVFFPKADLDRIIIDEAPTNGAGFGRMKSIRIIAQEASRRASYRSPLQQTGNFADSNRSKIVGSTKSRNLSGLANRPATESSLLRRKSTKMWGQKVVEVTLNSKNKKDLQKVIPKRGKNGEFVEFAWIKGELIGIGKFGKVYVAMNVTTGDLIAVKQMNINHKFLNRRETNDIVDTFKAEVDSLKDLDHVNIVQYLGFEIKDNTYSIFLEYVSGGSIGHLLRKYGRFEEPLVKYLTIQMLEGLNYIHSKGILHRDLKADNLLLEVDGALKISDFGISKKAKDIYTSQSKLNFQGTIFWMAPEIINDTHGVGYNAKVDIWALGCVVLEMFTGERPWSRYEGEGVLYKLGKEKEAPPIKKEIRKEISRLGKSFMERCFEIDATKRPTAQQLLNDPFCVIDSDFNFADTSLGKRIHVVEEHEKENLNKRMQSMVRKL